MSAPASEHPYRYIVVVWLHDHWSVNVATDDRGWAEEVLEKASEQVPALMVDARSGTVQVASRTPRLVEAVVRDRELPEGDG